MKVWIDAQISPAIALWLAARFQVEAKTVRDLGLRDAKDREIFFSAREADAVIVTKDADFVQLLERHGPPPRVVWLTTGNTSNARVRALLSTTWPKVVELLAAGESLVEVQSSR